MSMYLPLSNDVFAGSCVIPVTCWVVIVVVSIDELVRTVVTVWEEFWTDYRNKYVLIEGKIIFFLPVVSQEKW